MIVLGGCVGFGLNSLYTLGYTITQDAVASASMNGIGVATAWPVVIGCKLLVVVFGFWF